MKRLIKWILNIYNYLIHKEIELSPQEISWIKLAKLHYKDKFDYSGNWIELCKHLFREIYAYEPNEHYYDYLTRIVALRAIIHLN